MLNLGTYYGAYIILYIQMYVYALCILSSIPHIRYHLLIIFPRLICLLVTGRLYVYNNVCGIVILYNERKSVA